MAHLDSYGLLNLKVAKDRKGMAPSDAAAGAGDLFGGVSGGIRA